LLLEVKCKDTLRCRYNVVGVATRYGPHREKSWWAGNFRDFQTGPRAYSAPCTVNAESFTGVKLPERGA